MKRPAILIYVADWKNDERLQLCSLAARGLWFEIMGLMHDSEVYGYLVRDGRAMAVDEVATLVRATPEEVEALLSELLAAGVPGTIDAESLPAKTSHRLRKTPAETTKLRRALGENSSAKSPHVLYSRRMVRDERKRKEEAKRKRDERMQFMRVRKNVRDMSAGQNRPDGATRPENVQPSSSSLSSSLSSSSSDLRGEQPARAGPPVGSVAWSEKHLAVTLTDEGAAWLAAELSAHCAELWRLDPAGPSTVPMTNLDIAEGLRTFAANLAGKKKARPNAEALPRQVLDWLKTDLTRKRERSSGARDATDPFRELDRSWGDRTEETAKKIAACPRDHETEAVRGEPHKAGYVNEWCPDGCGWQRRVELEAKG